MELTVVFAFLLSGSGVILVSGMPQYNYPQPTGARPTYGPNSGSSSGPYEPSGDSSNSNSNSVSRRPGGGGGGGGGGGSGGPLQVECKKQDAGNGNYKFVCEGVDKELITLRSEHILWLQNNGGQQQVLDIEVPNYKIDELIKAGFKSTPGGGTQVNVLLKKPEQAYEAEVDTPSVDGGVPTVNLQYEPVEKQLVHFPNDKAYRPLSGPILPPFRQ